MFQNIVPLLTTAGKFIGRVAATTLVAMGTVKATEATVDTIQDWRRERKLKALKEKNEKKANRNGNKNGRKLRAA